MLKILAVSIGTSLLFFCVVWLKHNLGTHQEQEDEKRQSDFPEAVVDATLTAALTNLPIEIGTDAASEVAADAAVESVVEEGVGGIIEAVFEFVGKLFDGW